MKTDWLVNEDWQAGEPNSPAQGRGGGNVGVKHAAAEIAWCSPADIPLATASAINASVISSPPASPLLLLDQP